MLKPCFVPFIGKTSSSSDASSSSKAERMRLVGLCNSYFYVKLFTPFKLMDML